MKNVKSTDPRKKQVVNAIKAKSGANKVTLVKQLRDGSFQGHAMKGDRQGYQSLGMVTVTAQEAGIDVITLSSADMEIVAKALKNPPEPNEKLRQAFADYNDRVKK